MKPAATSPDGAPLSKEDVASIEELGRLTPVERFDQLVRTVRFIDRGRDAISRAASG